MNLRSLLLCAAILVVGNAIAAGVPVRVEGVGYLRLSHNGRAVFAKSATLCVRNGEVQESGGATLLPSIRVASTVFSVDESGWILVKGSKVARLLLAKFESEPEKAGPYLVSRDRAQLGYPTAEGFGKTISDASLPVAANLPGPTAPPPPPSGTTIQITIPHNVTVAGPKFTLGDIAEIKGPGAEKVREIDLGNAPFHGVPLLYTRERILARVTLLGHDRKSIELSMDETVEIRRLGQSVTSEQIIAKAKEAVLGKTGLKGALECTDRFADLQVPTGALELTAESVSVNSGIATVTVGIRVEGKRFLGRTVRLSGEALETAVQTGATVTVRFVSNGLVIEMPGRARSSGAIGQSIEVSVAAEGTATTTHEATIVSKGIVEVKA